MAYEVHIEEVPYIKRRNQTLAAQLVIPIVIFFYGLGSGVIMMIPVMALVIIVILLVCNLYFYKFHFITSVKVESGIITIGYTEKGKPLVLSSRQNDFTFYTDRERYTYTLNITCNGKRTLSQPQTKGWTRELMDDVCLATRKDKPLS